MRTPERILHAVSWISIKTKMKLILFLGLVMFPLALLVSQHHLTQRELTTILAAWSVGGIVLLLPVSNLCAYLLAIRNMRELNALCLSMKKGDMQPFQSLPPEPRDNDEFQRLRHNMYWMGHVIDSRKRALDAAFGDLEEAKNQIVESIEYASLIQRSFLPSADDLAALVPNHFLLWSQRDSVGGDFYWLRRTPDGFFLAVVDCTGHGVPGAFMTLIAHSLFEAVDCDALRGDPAGVLAAMNGAIKRALAKDGRAGLSDDGLDCTLIHVEPAARRMVLAGARGALYMRRPGAAVEEIRGDRCGVGYARSPIDFTFTNHEVALAPGTTFYMLTDGLTDQVGEESRFPFGKRRLREFIESHADTPLPEQRRLLLEVFEAHRGREPRRDDVTVLGFSL